MIFKLTMSDNSTREMELSPEQVGWITKNMLLNKPTPLYATTMAKKKYGDCKLGDIISIKEI